MENNNKSEGHVLKEKLLLERKNLGLLLDDKDYEDAHKFCEGYKEFLDKAKTEREAVEVTLELAKQNGFTEFDPSLRYNPGDKIYYNNRDKSLILCTVGKLPLDSGANIIASHIDSPRIDLKPNPLYEDHEVALFKTHYYGGIKKYQWASMPLSLHGIIIKENGDTVKVSIGEQAGDPVFCVNDLLPHLASEQMKRNASEIIKGEELNITVGLHPFRDDSISEKVKLNIMKLLNEKYGIVERDLISAELEVVPAFHASDVGLDRSMVGAYGQDDRICAYTSIRAALECEKPEKTIITVLADKEEIGSDGNTGMKSAFLKYFIADLAKPFNIEGRTVITNSKCISADVNAGFDPTFPDVLDRKNAAYLNYGVTIAKYTGSRGKGGTSDASAEFLDEITRLFDRNGVAWQIGELGKVDAGGGGTVAVYLAELNLDVIDVGVPVFSMHGPFEVTSKLDVFMAYRAFTVFYKNMLK